MSTFWTEWRQFHSRLLVCFHFSLQLLTGVKDGIFYLWHTVGPQRFNGWNILNFRYLTKFSMCVNWHFHTFVNELSPRGSGGQFLYISQGSLQWRKKVDCRESRCLLTPLLIRESWVLIFAETMVSFSSLLCSVCVILPRFKSKVGLFSHDYDLISLLLFYVYY